MIGVCPLYTDGKQILTKSFKRFRTWILNAIIQGGWWWHFLIFRASHSHVVSNMFKCDNVIKTGTVQCVSDSAAVLGKATAAVTIRKTLNFVTHWLALFKSVCNLKSSQLTVASVLFLQTRDVNVKLKKCNGWKFCREASLKTFPSYAWIPNKIWNFSSIKFKPVCGFLVNIFEILWQAETYVQITNIY